MKNLFQRCFAFVLLSCLLFSCGSVPQKSPASEEFSESLDLPPIGEFPSGVLEYEKSFYKEIFRTQEDVFPCANWPRGDVGGGGTYTPEHLYREADIASLFKSRRVDQEGIQLDPQKWTEVPFSDLREGLDFALDAAGKKLNSVCLPAEKRAIDSLNNLRSFSLYGAGKAQSVRLLEYGNREKELSELESMRKVEHEVLNFFKKAAFGDAYRKKEWKSLTERFRSKAFKQQSIRCYRSRPEYYSTYVAFTYNTPLADEKVHLNYCEGSREYVIGEYDPVRVRERIGFLFWDFGAKREAFEKAKPYGTVLDVFYVPR